MRTTIELSDDLYRRLRAEQVKRGLRGFSPLIEQAVETWLEHERDLADRVRAVAGSWTDEDVDAFERVRAEAWASWPGDPS